VTIGDTKNLTLHVIFHILTLLITDNSEIVAVPNFNIMGWLFIQWCFKVVTHMFLRYLHLWYLPTLHYIFLIMYTHSQSKQSGIFCRNISVPWKNNNHYLVLFKQDAVEFVLMYRFSWFITPVMQILLIVAISLGLYTNFCVVYIGIYLCALAMKLAHIINNCKFV